VLTVPVQAVLHVASHDYVLIEQTRPFPVREVDVKTVPANAGKTARAPAGRQRHRRTTVATAPATNATGASLSKPA